MSSDVENQEPKLYPMWKQLESELLARGLRDGETLPMEMLLAGLGIADPNAASSGADGKRLQFEFNMAMGDLCRSLLENHRINLRVVDSVGYLVVPPEEQTRLAMKDGGAEVSRALERMMRKVMYVRTDQLDDAQRKENADAIARAAALMQFSRKRLKGGE